MKTQTSKAITTKQLKQNKTFEFPFCICAILRTKQFKTNLKVKHHVTSVLLRRTTYITMCTANRFLTHLAVNERLRFFLSTRNLGYRVISTKKWMADEDNSRRRLT